MTLVGLSHAIANTVWCTSATVFHVSYTNCRICVLHVIYEWIYTV